MVAALHAQEAGMAGRPFWTGQLRISLVSFGIQLFPATSSTSEVSFHQIDRKTRQRVHHLNVINGDQPVDNSEVVKGYEYSKGKYVIVEPEEIKKLRLETQNAIDVAQFVDSKELPPSLLRGPISFFPIPRGPSTPTPWFAWPCSRPTRSRLEKSLLAAVSI